MVRLVHYVVPASIVGAFEPRPKHNGSLLLDWNSDCQVCGVWCVVCGVWYVVCGMWYAVCGMRYVVCTDHS